MRRRRRKITEPRLEFGRGAFSGYAGYRYGETRPVTLAGSQTREKPILKRAAKETLLNRVVELAKDWRYSPFESEGPVRAGLRVGFVSDGHAWARSDAQAAEIVAEALRIAAPDRPSWEEGQRGHALSSDYCHWCHGPIDEEDQSRGRRFCSAHCARVAVERMSRKTNHHYGAVLRSALRLITREEAEPQTCVFCAKSFQSDRKARFCSASCSASHQQGDRLLHPIPCGICETTFKPWNAKQRYCSPSCGQKANRLLEKEGLAGVRRECVECGTSFQPTTKHSRFCSKACGQRAGGRAHRERNKPGLPPPALCSWCGDEYQPKIALRMGRAGTCSDRCNSDKSRFGRGDVARKITRRTFDHFIVLPMDERWRRRMTAERFDWMAMEMGRTITGEATMPAPRITDPLFADA